MTKSAGNLDFSYRPARWVPHVKLAHHDLTQRVLAAIVRRFSTIELNQQMTINNLSLIYDRGDKEEVVYSVQLSEGGGSGRKRYGSWAESRYER